MVDITKPDIQEVGQTGAVIANQKKNKTWVDY